MTVTMDKCKRCGDAAVTSSRGEHFCRACFFKFVQFRHRKQLEKFKVDYSEPRPPDQHIMLALSLGQSSIALLDMCMDLIRLQKSTHRGRQGFYLHAVYVCGSDVDEAKRRLDKVRERYPELESLELVALDYSKATEGISSINRTSTQDITWLLQRQAIEQAAQKHGCQTTIYGHCQTRLAQLVLSLTAKGRGRSIVDEVEAHCPIREVLYTEVGEYNRLKQVEDLILPEAPIPATTKLQSVDDLVHQYFLSVEKEYPSVVSTVVRTSSKLQKPGNGGQEKCIICEQPIENRDWLEHITVDGPETAGQDLCYGCMVMLRGTDTRPRYSKDLVLQEYSINNDD